MPGVCCCRCVHCQCFVYTDQLISTAEPRSITVSNLFILIFLIYNLILRLHIYTRKRLFNTLLLSSNVHDMKFFKEYCDAWKLVQYPASLSHIFISDIFINNHIPPLISYVYRNVCLILFWPLSLIGWERERDLQGYVFCVFVANRICFTCSSGWFILFLTFKASVWKSSTVIMVSPTQNVLKGRNRWGYCSWLCHVVLNGQKTNL